jgi:hypothetical protein
LFKIRKILRGKLAALREGRIPNDEEFLPMLLEPVSPKQETVEPEPEDGVLEGEEGEDVPVEGENVGDENEVEEELERQVIENMENIVKQPAAHLSISAPFGETG